MFESLYHVLVFYFYALPKRILCTDILIILILLINVCPENVVCFITAAASIQMHSTVAHTLNHDQTAPKGKVLSGSILVAFVLFYSLPPDNNISGMLGQVFLG